MPYWLESDISLYITPPILIVQTNQILVGGFKHTVTRNTETHWVFVKMEDVKASKSEAQTSEVPTGGWLQ